MKNNLEQIFFAFTAIFEKINVIFDTPQKGVTKGQSAVFYVDDIVLGGGIIC